MATHFSPCSSSSTNFLPSSCFKNETTVLFSRFAVTVPRKSTWVTQIHSRIQGRKHFHIKSSNGHPLNAVSLQDGLDGSPTAKEHDKSQGKEKPAIPISEAEKEESTLSITVVGASGDLAKKKIFPALFALFYEDWLPENFTVFGYARTKLTDEELRNMISGTLTCRIDRRENCEDKMDQFLKRCFYHAGQYDSEGDFSELDSKLKEKEVICLFCGISIDSVLYGSYHLLHHAQKVFLDITPAIGFN